MVQRTETCSQCGKPAIFNFKGHLLCLSCYQTIHRMNIEQHNQLVDEENRILDNIEFTTGIPIPRTKPITPIINQGNTVLHSIKIDKSIVGVVNTGLVNDIGISMKDLDLSGNTELANLIKQFTEAVLQEKTINQKDRDNILENLAFLVAEARIEKEKQKHNIVRSVLENTASILRTTAVLLPLWQQLKALLEKLF